MAPKTAPRHAITVHATNVRPSGCAPDSPGAVDVDVEVTIADGRHRDQVFVGEVTLALDPVDDGTYCSYSDMPDQWISGELLRVLRAGWDKSTFLAALSEMEEQAAKRALEVK